MIPDLDGAFQQQNKLNFSSLRLKEQTFLLKGEAR
jgi:hypothetical protein